MRAPEEGRAHIKSVLLFSSGLTPDLTLPAPRPRRKKMCFYLMHAILISVHKNRANTYQVKLSGPHLGHLVYQMFGKCRYGDGECQLPPNNRVKVYFPVCLKFTCLGEHVIEDVRGQLAKVSSLPPLWGLEIECRASDLAASSFTCPAILAAPGFCLG